NYANYNLTFTGNRIYNVANYTITHNNSASYAYNLIATSAYSVGITTTTAAFRVSDGGVTIGSKSTAPTKVLDVVGDARIRTVSNDNALTNLLAIDANGNIYYRTSSSLAPSTAALTKVDDTNVTLTLGGSPNTSLLAATSITVGWTGTLSDGRIASSTTWNAKIGGSGTTNYLSKFTASGTIGNSLIRDDGSTIGVNNAPDASYKLYINSDKIVGLGVFNNAASGTNNFGISGSATNANSASNVGVFGNALLSSGGTNLGVRGQSASQTITDSTSIISAGSNVGGFFQANASSATSYGLVSSADALSNQPSATFIGALLRANNAGTRYAAQLIDGTEGSGKFFKSVTSSGHGNWAALAASDITSGLGSALQYLRVNAGATALEYATFSASNLGSANLTSADDARTFTLKSGTSSSQNLQILNSAGANLFTGRGDNKVIFGSSSIGLSIDKYLNNSVTTDTYINNVLFNRIQTNQRGELWYNAAGSAKVQISGTGEVSLFGALTEYNIYNASNNRAVILACSNANTGQLLICNSSGVTKTVIEVGYSVFDSLMKIGGSYAVATAQLQVVGSGSTSATTTALFQNSSSVNYFKLLDDGRQILSLPSTAPTDS
ncbi:hypothetical protein EB001_23465, partial [bacterium]|nr:hypothetical protein [bacterium]